MATCDQCKHSAAGDGNLLCRLNPPVPMLAGINRVSNAPMIISAWPTVPAQGTCSHVEVAIQTAVRVP